MLSLVIASSTSRVLVRFGSAPRKASLVLNPVTEYFSSSAENGDEVIAIVKKWDRKRSYGFLRAIGANEDSPDIFVHREGIRSELSKEQFPNNPFLRTGEHVRCRVVENEPGKYIANDVVFENGDPIPALRKGYLWSKINDAKSACGDLLIEAMEQNKGSMTDQEKIGIMDKALSTYNEKVAYAEELIQRMGMNVADFQRTEPTDEVSKPGPRQRSDSNRL